MTSAHWDDTVDVVVVGSGGGIAGAYTAAREGLSVALVEATEKFGGTTAYSGGGGMWFPANPVLRRAGADDTIEDALTYFHAVVGDRRSTQLGLEETLEDTGAVLFRYDHGIAWRTLAQARLTSIALYLITIRRSRRSSLCSAYG